MTKMFYDGAQTLQERINLNIGSGISSLITYLMMGRDSQEVQAKRGVDTWMPKRSDAQGLAWMRRCIGGLLNDEAGADDLA